MFINNYKYWSVIKLSFLIKDNSLVLFQGDSITDRGRDREDFNNLGYGYPMMAASWFSALYPEKKVKFLNRGISGDRVADLKNRWQKDCLDLKPDILSILIGINDCLKDSNSSEITSADSYKAVYHYILTQTRKRFPNIPIIICEPFVLPYPEDRKKWRVNLDSKIHVARDLAVEFNALYIPLDSIFAQASTKSDYIFWSSDGVHPTPAGHALIAQNWLKTIGA